MPLFREKILITGATGFIGKHIIHRYIRENCAVSAMIYPDERSALPSKVRLIPCDIINQEKVIASVREISPDIIIHLAAAGVTDPAISFLDSFKVNVMGAINILEAAHVAPSLRKLIMFGSSYEYGARRSDDVMDPFNAYSASKVAAWAYSRAAFNSWNLPIVWIRPFQVYGPGQPVKAFIPSAIRSAINGQNFQMTAGAQKRDFIYISDIVDGLIAAISANDIGGRTLDLGTGKLTPLLDAVKLIWNITEAKGHIMAGALPYREGEVSAIAANVHRTRLLTNWESAVSLPEGLSLTIKAVQDSLRCKSEEAI